MNLMTSVAAPVQARGFSADEFERMIAAGAFEDMWVELIAGEIEKVSPPQRRHSQLQMSAIAALLKAIPADRLFGEVAIRVTNDTVVASDIAIVRDAAADRAVVTPDELLLIVEVATSSLDRDLTHKRRLYAAAGIPTYWVVDALREVVHVFDRPADGDYAGLALVRFGDPLAVPGTDAAITLN